MTDFNRDSGRERNTRRSDSRVPPHNLNAEESLLGALLLIEKDFVCLDHTLEDQSDNYANPNKVC